MNKDELAQWLVDYLHSNFQIRDAQGRPVGRAGTDVQHNKEDLAKWWLQAYVGDLRKPLGGFEKMAEALLDAMKPPRGECWCNCHDEASVPEEAESIPLTPPDVLVRPKGPVWMRVVIRETCPVCQGQSKPSKCGTCGGFGTIESAMPLDQLMGIYFAEVNKEVEDQIKKGIL